MAYKDEYEVARLHAAATYGEKPVFHLSPPLITGIDPADRPAAQDRPARLARAAAVPRAAARQGAARDARSICSAASRAAEERALPSSMSADLRAA